MTLTSKQERFVAEYLVDLNATRAAIRAGYSEKTAAEQASRLLTNVKVQQAVSDAQNRVAEKAEWSAADRLRMLADIAERTKSSDPRVAVSAIAEANKMQGSHSPIKQDHTSSDGSMSPRPTVIRIVAADDGSDNFTAAEVGADIQ